MIGLMIFAGCALCCASVSYYLLARAFLYDVGVSDGEEIAAPLPSLWERARERIVLRWDTTRRLK